jgi:signal transduction histidine kinase
MKMDAQGQKPILLKKCTILIICFINSFFAFGQEDNFSEDFSKLQKQIENRYYDIDKQDTTLLMANKLITISKNNVEKAVALYVKANVILYGSLDVNSGEIAVPYALECGRILSNEKNDVWFQRCLGFISVCYNKKYDQNTQDSPMSKVSVYFTNLSLKVQENPGLRPAIDFKQSYDNSLASKAELKELIKNNESNLAYWVKKGSIEHQMYRNQTIGRLKWYVSKNYDITEDHLKKALLFSDSCKNLDFRYVILNTFSSLGLEAKEYQKAKYYAALNLQDVLKSKNETREAIIQDLLYAANKGLGLNEEAFRHKERSFEINEKYYRQTEIGRSKLLKERNQVLEKQVGLQNELDKQRNIRILLGVIIAALMLAFAAMIYYNRSLLQKNKEISEAMLQGQTIERKRVAMDLHDNLGSTLSALWISLDTIDQSKMNKGEKTIHNTLRENLEQAYNDVRLLSHNLLPEEFEKKGLVPSLESFVRNLNKNGKINFELNISADFGRLDKKVEFELYSVCLELLNNILKHSKASIAFVELFKTEGQVSLLITDNGTGAINTDSDGRGLSNVRARIDSINGTWKVDASENQGLRNEISLKI